MFILRNHHSIITGNMGYPGDPNKAGRQRIEDKEDDAVREI